MTQTPSTTQAMRGPGRMPTMVGLTIRVVELVLLLALTFVLARMIWLLAFGASAGDFRQDRVETAIAVGSGGSYAADINRLSQTNLFTDPRTAAVASAAPTRAPETQLALVLRGVRRGASADTGGAIIQTPDNRQRFYRVGSEILDGVTLDGVLVDHVRISRRGIAEILYLRPEAAAAARETGAASEGRVTTADGASRRGQLEDVAGLFQVRARYSGQTLTGYRIESGNAAMLSVLGLRETDVITAIEGRPVAAIGDLHALMARDGGDTSIRFSISRGGLPLTISRTLPQ